MILIDTTVWIDFFADRDTKQTLIFTRLIEQQEDIAICGVILSEILQGIRNAREHREIERSLDQVIYLEMTKSTFILAADIYRHLRAGGITIRKSIDCMIAATAIENKFALLHNDRDFDAIAKHSDLRVLKAMGTDLAII